MNPTKEIRDFDGRDYIGKFATIECCHTDVEVNDKKKIPTMQYVSFVLGDVRKGGQHISGWVPSVLGKKGEKIRKKILNVTLIEHNNGGRGHTDEHRSYKEFFDDKRKKIVMDYWRNGSGMGQLFSGASGDPDQADIKVYFDDYAIDSMAFDFEAPEEWYSELHKDNPIFRFPDGFYENAEKAIAVFTQKQHDDMFGERYFPVIVFPKSKADDANAVAGWAKACSRAIINNGNVIYGTRCKPHELAEVIGKTYENGGRVAIGAEWNWE